MSLRLDFLDRDFSDRVPTPWKHIDVPGYSWHAIGGPRQSKATAFGGKLAVWEFAEMMRCPVTIWDVSRAKEVWWGYLNKADIYDGDFKTSVVLEPMANSIAVVYTLNTEQFTTSYATNADSIAEYGTKQLLETAREMTDAQAENYRNTRLVDLKYPLISKPVPQVKREKYAELEFLGWWETLRWRYYTKQKGTESYEDINSFIGREIGEDDRPICAQSFQNSSGEDWEADAIHLRIRMEGASTSSVRVDLCQNTAFFNIPGASLANCTLTYDNFTDMDEWVEFQLSARVNLVAGTTYWIKIQKLGAIDEENYYLVKGNDTAGYPYGQLKLYNTSGGGWETWEGVECDLNFKVTGTEETTAQMETIESDCGEFLIDVDILDASGIYQSPTRIGQTTALYEFEELLKRGTSNNLRMLARILKNLHVEVYEEPELYEADYTMDWDGTLRDNLGALVPATDCPVGIWLHQVNVIPSTVDVSRLSNPGYRFVEAAEYSARNGYEIRETKERDYMFELFGIVDG